MLDDYKDQQPIVYKMLINAIKKNRNSHAYLFEIHGNSKALEIVLSFVKYVLCPKNYSNREFCKNCNQCRTIDDNNYIELKIIKPDGLWIKKEELTELQKEFSKKAITGNKKIYIITEADKLNQSSANSILKFLEEPEENIIAILMVENKYQLLDTILSRCQILSLLNTEKNSSNNYYDKINNIINNEQIDAEITNKIIEFINFYEKNGIDTLLHLQKLWHQYFQDKKIIADAFEIMLLYYMDVLNISCGYNINIFDSNTKELELIKNNNTINQLIYKINTILKLKENIKFNINSSLLMDKLILEFEEGKND